MMGACVRGDNEAEGTALGAEQTWMAGRGEGRGKHEGRSLIVQGGRRHEQGRWAGQGEIRTQTWQWESCCPFYYAA